MIRYVVTTTFMNLTQAVKKILLAAVLCAAICAPAVAVKWQLMLIPQAQNNDIAISSKKLDEAYSHIEEGLSLSITRSAQALIDPQRAFSTCQLYLCGQQNIHQLLQVLQERAPNVHLVILYAYASGAQPSLNVRLLEPVSLQVKFADSLVLVGETTPESLRALGQDMGTLIVATLAKSQPQKRYSVSFNNFLSDELNSVTPTVLANHKNTQLVLRESSIEYYMLGKYFPVTNSEYSLQTSLSTSQVKQMLTGIFARQNIPITIDFSQQNNANITVKLFRQGNPYSALLITCALILTILTALFTIYLRRKHLHNLLLNYDEKRNANMWLATHKKASFPIFILRKKWALQHTYWTRSHKESSELSSQAKLCFDAGDVNTSKLFLTKALYANTANQQAKKLTEVIQALENDEISLTENEQWIQTKLAKAMNNYRQNQPLKALRQLYQALNNVQHEDALNRQIKAIKKLIKQIKKELAQDVSTLVISCSGDTTNILLCQNRRVHMGRRSDNESETWISQQDAVFYINHKSVSRVGHHCFIQRQETGFYLIDSNSKNGSFINNSNTTPHQPHKLHNSDTIQLGTKNKLLGAPFLVELSSKGGILQLVLDAVPFGQNEQQARNRLWPDANYADNIRLVMLQKECLLVYNTSTKSMSICEEGQLSFEQKKVCIAVCLITLGRHATISPIEYDDNTSVVEIDSIALLGEVPLKVPCSLHYENIEFQLNDYNSSSIRNTQGREATRQNISNALPDTDNQT